MDIQEFLGHFSGVGDEPDGYLALCPAHGDRTPSLRIWIGTDRKARLACRTGCETDAVRQAAGLRWADLFDVSGDALTVPVERPALVGLPAVAGLRVWLDALPIRSDALAYAADRFGVTTEQAAELGLRSTDPVQFPSFEAYEAAVAAGEHPAFSSRGFARFPRLVVSLDGFDGVARGAQGRDLSGDCPGRWLSLRNPEGQAWAAYGTMFHGFPSETVLVTEGPGDGLTAYAAGFDAVAIRGAGLSHRPELIAEIAKGLLDRGTQRVAITADADKAGRANAERLAAGFRTHGLVAEVLAMPAEGMDLTDWRGTWPAGFAAELDSAVAELFPDPEPEGAEFDDAYWAQQRMRLDISTEIRHVYFAEFVADHTAAHLKFVPNVGWYRWTGVVWEHAGSPLQAITDAVGVLAQRVADQPADTSWATAAMGKMLVNFQRKAIASEMEVLAAFHASVDDLDTARHLLTFRNGTVDLRTGQLREHRAADMLTQCAPVNYVPGAPAPRWARFVQEIFPGDAEQQAYLQTFLGYCISGETRDHVLGVWYGSQGRNGKGTTIRAMQAAFGPAIIREVDFGLFENIRGQAPHTEQIAGLRGARMVVAQEGNPGTPMDTARLKNWSGGDRIETRHLHGKTFTFDPNFTIVLATNHLPEFAAGGAALWSRTKALLFGQSFADRRDPDLEPTITGPEREGVAAWAVAGAVRYYAEGLRDTVGVLAATEHHKDEVDPLKDLVGEVFDYVDGHATSRTAFNADLKEWRDTNGEKSAKFTPSAVKRHLLGAGRVREVKRSGGWFYVGVRLRSEPLEQGGPGIFNHAEE